MGFVDLHLHLLPGVDDGAKTMADSLAMARLLTSLGFAEAAPSPHNQVDYAPREICAQRLIELQQELDGADIKLKLHTNSENQFVDETLFEKGRRLAGGPYMLIEAPYVTPLPSLLDMVFRLKLKGITPLIAHPERCVEFDQRNRAREVVERGALLQLDIGAVIGRYGPRAEKLATQFLSEGLYAVGATDLHSPHNAEAWLTKSLTTLEKRVGAAGMRKLLEETPSALLRGEVTV